MDVRRKKHVEREVLLEVSRSDAPYPFPANSEGNDRAVLCIEAPKRRVPVLVVLAKHHPGMRVKLEVELTGVDRLALGQLIDQRAIDISRDHARVELIDRNTAAFVGLRLEPECIGANAEIRVHGHENERLIRMFVSEIERHLQDEAVHLSRPASSFWHLGRYRNPKLATGAFERHALIERVSVLGSQLVEDAREVACVLPELAELFLELIDLFDDKDR